MANPTSRLTQARAAIRPEMKGRVMLSGPPGAGKTYSGLIIATALVGEGGRILVVDSEKESALTYADLFTFDHLRWNPPFDPTALAMTLKEAQGEYDAVIVDSFSHWWRKQGGVLDIAGDNIRGWKVARPVQEDLIDVLLDVDLHVIVCCRSKMDHSITQEGGKTVVTKLGVKAQQDDDLEYEVNVALEVDMAHVISVVKSRTNEVPVGTQFLAGYAGDFALHYRDWLRSGEPVAEKEETDALAEALGRIPDEVERKRAKYQFLDEFGRPEFLLVSRLPEAKAWVADRLLGVALPVERAPDAVPSEGQDGVGVKPEATSSGGSGEGSATSAGNSAQAPSGSDSPGGVASLTPGNSGAADPSAPAEVPPADPAPTSASADGETAETAGEAPGPDSPQPDGTGASPATVRPPSDTDPPLPPNGAVINSRTGAITETVDLPPCADDSDPGGEAPPAETAGPSPDLVESIQADVAKMTVEQVRSALSSAGLGSSGAPAAIRKRLIGHRITASVTVI